jgi:tetratricopeptide (TPR) repeat protein
MKALEKDRTRRYETANSLATDIERHLENEPVEARPPSKLYRFQKLVRRNKLAFGAASALAIALLLGAVVSVSQAVRATRAEAAAMRSQMQAEAINRFLTEDLLYQTTPDFNANEKNVTMKEVLEKAARRLDQNAAIANEPQVETRLRLAFGNTYSKLGALGDAERHLRRAVALGRASLGPRHEITLAAQEALAWLLVGGMKSSAEGEQLSHDTWQTRRQVLGPDHRDTLDSMDTYATALVQQRKLEQAEAIYRQCLEVRGRVLGTNDPEFLVTLGNLGQVLAERGNLEEAERVVRDVIQRRTQAGLAETKDTFANIFNLTVILLVGDRLDEAERMLADAQGRATRLFGAENPASTLLFQRVHARALTEQGRFQEAEALAAQTLAAHRRVLSSPEAIGRTLLVLGHIKVEQGDLQQAEPLLAEALQLFREHSPSKRDFIAQAANWLGAVHLARGAYPEAENLLLTEADQFLARSALLSTAERQAGLRHIVQLYERWKKPDQAALWQHKLDQIPPAKK